MEGGMVQEDDRGIIPRSMQRLFEVRDKMVAEQGWSFEMEASQLEIYNEAIRDLLATAGGTAPESSSSFAAAGSGGGGGIGNGMTSVKHGANGDTSVNGLSTHSVSGVDDVLALLRTAQQNRSVACTKMNAASSRSHAVFLLKVKATHVQSGATRGGHLVLVDLAGSEKIAQSGAKGEQLKEANAINKSLSSLGNVIVALAKKQKHVPFRDSTLTYLLQNCLSGDSKTLMLVNVSPSTEHTSETLCSLRFAQKVNNCEVGVAKKHGAGAAAVAAASSS
jgi:kinesin family protein C1